MKIALYGDSLTRELCDRAIPEELAAYFAVRSIEFPCHGVDSDKIIDIKGWLKQAMMEDQYPDAVILYYDSDVSNIPEEYMLDPKVVHANRNAYRNTLRDTLNIITEQNNASIIALAGPSLLGEGYFGLFPEWYLKAPMLDAYRDMNRDIISEYPGASYLDVRHAFLEALPTGWPHASGCVTVDGEHENDRGAAIIGSMYAHAIESWLVTSGRWNEQNMLDNQEAMSFMFKVEPCTQADATFAYIEYIDIVLYCIPLLGLLISVVRWSKLFRPSASIFPVESMDCREDYELDCGRADVTQQDLSGMIDIPIVSG
jgi:hypothetical protein